MKLFKKALLATAIFGAMGAHAADVSDAVKFTSVEGFAAANNVVGTDGSVRVIVREKLEAGDKVTLQFGKGFGVIAGVEAAVYTVPGTRDAVTSKSIAIDNGTAAYTFTVDTVESDFAKGKVVLELDTGYTIELDESFEVVAAADAFLTTATQANATVTYSAARWQDGVAKDTVGDNTGTFLKFANQYGASVTGPLNAVIERSLGTTFTSGADANSTTADTLAITLTDKVDFLDSVKDPITTIEISGDFSDMDQTTPSNDITVGVGTGTTAIFASGDAALTLTDSLLTVVLTDTRTDGQAGTLTLSFDNAITRIATNSENIKATTFVADAEVDYGHTSDAVILANAAAGAWTIDATIINVPYFPVGFDGTDTSVHFANEGSKDVNVIMTAIDDSGKVYEAVDMGDLVADTVTKYKQTDIMTAFGITAKTKLSVTFNIDATDGVVNAYAFSSTPAGRQALVTSQQKGIK